MCLFISFFYLSIYLYYLCIPLSTCLSLCGSLCLCLCFSLVIYLAILSLSLSLRIYLSIYQSIYLFISIISLYLSLSLPISHEHHKNLSLDWLIFVENWFSWYFDVTFSKESFLIMVLILVGNLEVGAHVQSDLGWSVYIICLYL